MHINQRFQQGGPSPLTMLMLGFLGSALIVGVTWFFTLDVLLSVVALFTTLPTVIFWTILKYFNEKSAINQRYASGSSLFFFLLGAIGIIPIVMAEFVAVFIIVFFISLFAIFNVLLSFFIVLVIAAFIEEIAKLMFIKKALGDHGHVSVMRVIYFGLVAVIAFASVENVLYVLNAVDEGIENAIIVSLLRSLLSVPLHVLTGTFIVKYYLEHLRSNPWNILYRIPPQYHARSSLQLPRYIPILQQGNSLSWYRPHYYSHYLESSVGRWHYLGIPSLIHLTYNVSIFFLSQLHVTEILSLIFSFFVGIAIMYPALYYNFKWFWKIKDLTLIEFLQRKPQL